MKNEKHTILTEDLKACVHVELIERNGKTFYYLVLNDDESLEISKSVYKGLLKAYALKYK